MRGQTHGAIGGFGRSFGGGLHGRDIGSRCGESGPAGPQPLPAGDYPAGAQPGECFAKVLVPEVAETTSERVLVTPERTISRVLPGQCSWQDRTEVVREPSVEMINRPATYRTLTENVVVRPAGFRTETAPPVYEDSD